MKLTAREVHWRLKMIAKRKHESMRFEAALAGIQIPDVIIGDSAPETLSPEMEDRIARHLRETQERLRKHG